MFVFPSHFDEFICINDRGKQKPNPDSNFRENDPGICKDPLLPAHISRALCGRSVWSAWVWLCSQNVRWSCRLPLLRPRPRPQLPRIHRPSPALPLPLPAACCLSAWAGGPEGPPPGRLGCWDLQQHIRKEQTFSKWHTEKKKTAEKRCKTMTEQSSAIKCILSAVSHPVIPPLQVWTERLLCMCCVPVARIYVCSLLFTHCTAHWVYRRADMTATSINWQMLNSEVALLLCERMLNRKLYLL